MSTIAGKLKGGEAEHEMHEDKQGPNEHESRIEVRPPSGSNKELQSLDDWWLKYSQEREQQQKQELQRKTDEIQSLTVGSPLMISILFLISL